MSALLIEPILDRYVALVEKRERNWSPKEVEALLLKLREEVLQCLKTWGTANDIHQHRSSEGKCRLTD
jgi:hypothetical protein